MDGESGEDKDGLR